MKTPRMCSRFYCDERGDRFCCADCGHSHRCVNPCLNDPSRCGLEDRTGRVRKQEVVKVKGG